MKKTVTLQIQAVLYETPHESLMRSLLSLANAVSFSQAEGVLGAVTVRWGDASSHPLLSEERLSAWKEDLKRSIPTASLDLQYCFFNENTGYGKGHNRLAKDCQSDFLLILNPDVVVCHDFFSVMLAPFEDETVGLTEARQTPVEHPKFYNETTGETHWSSGACFVIPTALYRDLGGFDDESFFMYWEDVDLSLRIREKGKRLLYLPTAPVYHSRTFDSRDGSLYHTATELRYSAESQLVFAYKWRLRSMLRLFKESFRHGNELEQAAWHAFEERLKKGILKRVTKKTWAYEKQLEKRRFFL